MYYNPIDFPEATHSMGAPLDWDENRGECLPLPVQKLDTGGYVSMWALGNRVLELTILSNAHPVVSIRSIQ